MKTLSLDLGCGKNPRNVFGADIVYGIDIREDLEKNIIKADLVLEKIPFEDNTFDFITAHDFIEHIPRVLYLPQRRNAFVELMNEVWRTLKHGGKFLSITPAFPKPQAFGDPTHVNYISETTFTHYFDDEHSLASVYGFYGAFKVEEQRWDRAHLISVLVKTDKANIPNL